MSVTSGFFVAARDSCAGIIQTERATNRRNRIIGLNETEVSVLLPLFFDCFIPLPLRETEIFTEFPLFYSKICAGYVDSI
jgi:hypothetical protein